MTITRKMVLIAMMLAAVCAIALGGCGNAGASSSAAADASAAASLAAGASSSASSSSASAQQADEQALPYVGTWKADKLILEVKAPSSSGKDSDLDVPVVLELRDDMTGALTVGESTQAVEWEVRYWESLKVQRAVITLHEPFELGSIVCDTDNLMLEFGDSENSGRLFYHWTSSVQSGAKLGVDMTVQRAS